MVSSYKENKQKSIDNNIKNDILSTEYIYTKQID